MKKSTELYQALDAVKIEMETLRNEGKVEDAHAKIKEIKDLQVQIAAAEAEEQAQIENFEGEKMNETKDKVNEVVAFNKAVLGKPLTEAENALVEGTDENGGYLVPRQQKTQIEELKRQLIPLKEYCRVVPVGTMAGSMPLEVKADDTLVDFDEMTELNQSSITFGNVTWSLKNKGDIIPVSNILLQDEKANLTNYIGRRFAKKAVRTENKDIIAELEKATKVQGTSYTVIEQVLNVTLDPAIAQSAIIITDQDGFHLLDQLVDDHKQKLLGNDLSNPTIKRFKGRQVVVMPNGSITKPTGSNKFYVGDLGEYLAFFDRGVYEMATSKEAGFTKNATYMRVIERYDVKAIDKDAMRTVIINKPAAPSTPSNPATAKATK